MEVTKTFKHKGRAVTMVCDDPVTLGDYLSNRFYEHGMLDWIDRNIPKGGTWIDVGANNGNHSVFFAIIGADRVVAFEPVDENYDHLVRNMRTNTPRADDLLLNAGAGEVAGQLKYDPPSGGKRWSQVQLGQTGERTAPIITIDSLGLTNVRLIKLDCEGMEGPALLGAIETIKRDLPELFIEIWEANDLAEFTANLGLLGYTMIERFNEAPTYFFSASGRYPVTYTPPK